jgi:tetratricopeptide (TPR) repeat protein
MNLAIPGLAIFLLAAPAFAAPDDMDDAHQALKEAVQAKKDAAEVKKLAAQVYALAHPLASSPESEELKEAIAHAREVETYTEYALYATALQSPPEAAVDLLDTLEQQNPKSKYLDEGYGNYFVALHKAQAGSKILPIAEKAIANFPNNPDLLLVLADSALTRKQFDRAVSYGQRLAAAAGEHKRNAAMGRGHWIAGVAAAGSPSPKWAVADKELRAALPFINDSEEMTGNALFYLGLANYQMGKMTLRKAQVLEAVKFSEQAAGMKCSTAQQAFKNARLMKLEADKMR